MNAQNELKKTQLGGVGTLAATWSAGWCKRVLNRDALFSSFSFGGPMTVTKKMELNHHATERALLLWRQAGS